MPRVTLVKSGKHFEVESDETVLDAAERAGIIMAHSCLSGTCRACITQVLSGCVEHDPEYIADLSIDRGELEAGYRLLCSAFVYEDAELDR